MTLAQMLMTKVTPMSEWSAPRFAEIKASTKFGAGAREEKRKRAQLELLQSMEIGERYTIETLMEKTGVPRSTLYTRLLDLCEEKAIESRMSVRKKSSFATYWRTK